MKIKSVGILGGGQLCQMLAEFLVENGTKVYFIDPSKAPPAKFTKSIHIQKKYTDKLALDLLIENCDVVTYEFENIPIESLDYLSKKITIFPSPYILSISQNRLNEKNNFIKCGIDTPKFISYKKNDSFQKKIAESNMKFPMIIKTNRMGYDGKGQYQIKKVEDLEKIKNELSGNIDYIIEEKIDFFKEISVIIGRNKNDEVVCFDPIENIHKNGILDISIFPSRIDGNIKKEAILLAEKFVKEIDLRGLVAIEMFLDKEMKILFNEIAPRPHNSGHLTRETHSLSQFGVLGNILTENIIETPKPKYSAIMKNILGDFFTKKDYEKRLTKIAASPNHYLKMYNKDEPKIGRKMGHITIITKDIQNSIVKINDLIN